MSNIALSASQRRNLLTLQDVTRLSERTEERLTSGKKVNTVLDDAVTYFRAKSLGDTAKDFSDLRDDINIGVSAINAYLAGVEAIENLLGQLKGIVENSRSQTTLERVSTTSQFRTLGEQINNLVEDTSFNGIDLLARTTSELNVRFGTRTASTLQVGGLNLNNSAVTAANVSLAIFSVNAFSNINNNFLVSAFGLVSPIAAGGANIGFSIIGTNNSYINLVDSAVQVIDQAIDRIRGHAAYFGNNVSILQVRLTFTGLYTNELEGARDKLVLADLNEEGANLITLQTRQQLGIQSLRVSNQNQQAILSLLN